MDLASFAAANYREFTIAGELFRVRELTLREWAAFQAFLKVKAPGPLALLRADDLAGLHDADRRAIINRAYEENRVWPPRLGSPGWFAAIERAGPEANAELVRALLLPDRPDLSIERAGELADALDLPTVLDIFVVAMGAESDPKSPASPDPAPVGRNRRARRARRPGRR